MSFLSNITKVFRESKFAKKIKFSYRSWKDKLKSKYIKYKKAQEYKRLTAGERYDLEIRQIGNSIRNFEELIHVYLNRKLKSPVLEEKKVEIFNFIKKSYEDKSYCSDAKINKFVDMFNSYNAGELSDFQTMKYLATEVLDILISNVSHAYHRYQSAFERKMGYDYGKNQAGLFDLYAEMEANNIDLEEELMDPNEKSYMSAYTDCIGELSKVSNRLEKEEFKSDEEFYEYINPVFDPKTLDKLEDILSYAKDYKDFVVQVSENMAYQNNYTNNNYNDNNYEDPSWFF